MSKTLGIEPAINITKWDKRSSWAELVRKFIGEKLSLPINEVILSKITNISKKV